MCHALSINGRSGTIERLAEVINRSHGTDMACCIAAIRALVQLADRSSIGIREVYLSSGCLPLLLQVTQRVELVMLDV